MNESSKVVKIFTIEQQFPCGPKSNCCGPVGQNETEVTALKKAIQELQVNIEIYDVKKLKNLQAYPQVFKLFTTFGPQAIPIITVDNEVVCMGKSDIKEAVSAIKAQL